jgi:hypothetical protein
MLPQFQDNDSNDYQHTWAKKKEGKIPMSCAYAMALAPQVHVPRARVIELA